MEIKITNPSGGVLKTAKTYCEEDINVVPELQEVTVAASDTEQVVMPSQGFAGIKKVTVPATGGGGGSGTTVNGFSGAVTIEGADNHTVTNDNGTITIGTDDVYNFGTLDNQSGDSWFVTQVFTEEQAGKAVKAKIMTFQYTDSSTGYAYSICATLSGVDENTHIYTFSSEYGGALYTVTTQLSKSSGDVWLSKTYTIKKEKANSGKPSITLNTSEATASQNHYGRAYYTWTVTADVATAIAAGEYNVTIYDQNSGGGYFYCPLAGHDMSWVGERLIGAGDTSIAPSQLTSWSFYQKDGATVSFWYDTWEKHPTCVLSIGGKSGAITLGDGLKISDGNVLSVKKEYTSITNFVDAYNDGFNFNGKKVTFTSADYVAGGQYYCWRINFANGYRIEGYAGGGMSITAYNPYASATEDIYDTASSSKNTLPQSYEFRDGSSDIGTNCTITGFFASDNSTTYVQITAEEFSQWINIVFEDLKGGSGGGELYMHSIVFLVDPSKSLYVTVYTTTSEEFTFDTFCSKFGYSQDSLGKNNINGCGYFHNGTDKPLLYLGVSAVNKSFEAVYFDGSSTATQECTSSTFSYVRDTVIKL